MRNNQKAEGLGWQGFNSFFPCRLWSPPWTPECEAALAQSETPEPSGDDSSLKSSTFGNKNIPDHLPLLLESCLERFGNFRQPGWALVVSRAESALALRCKLGVSYQSCWAPPALWLFWGPEKVGLLQVWELQTFYYFWKFFFLLHFWIFSSPLCNTKISFFFFFTCESWRKTNPKPWGEKLCPQGLSWTWNNN